MNTSYRKIKIMRFVWKEYKQTAYFFAGLILASSDACMGNANVALRGKRYPHNR